MYRLAPHRRGLDLEDIPKPRRLEVFSVEDCPKTPLAVCALDHRYEGIRNGVVAVDSATDDLLESSNKVYVDSFLSRKKSLYCGYVVCRETVVIIDSSRDHVRLVGSICDEFCDEFSVEEIGGPDGFESTRRERTNSGAEVSLDSIIKEYEPFIPWFRLRRYGGYSCFLEEF